MAVKCPFVHEVILPASVGIRGAGTCYISFPNESIGMKEPVLPRSPLPSFCQCGESVQNLADNSLVGEGRTMGCVKCDQPILHAFPSRGLKTV